MGASERRAIHGPGVMIRYRVPWMHMPYSAKYKARLSYCSRYSAADRSDAEHVATPGSQWVEFEAASHESAAKLLNTLILPADTRPVWRRKQVSDWAMSGGGVIERTICTSGDWLVSVRKGEHTP